VPDAKSPFRLIAGHVALDFANTLDDAYAPTGIMELLPDYESLLVFSEQSGVLSASDCRSLERGTSEASKAKALHEAHGLRTAVLESFTSLATTGSPSVGAVSTLNGFLEKTLLHRKLSNIGGVHWTWEGVATDAHAPLWPIAFEAAELLVSKRRELVRMCSVDTCRWLFLDTSKNHGRRWCDMNLCGNRVKARKHYSRTLARDSSV
jgi:predicted RNA-binding Zn ribbon-like protein